MEIGTLLSMSGPTAAIGEDARNGARVAADLLDPPGEILGHAIEWVDEDDRCSVQGKYGARDLASDPDVVTVIGTTCSVAALGVSDTILGEQGIVLISPSNTHPMLTDPPTHHPFYLRVIPPDATSEAGDGPNPEPLRGAQLRGDEFLSRYRERFGSEPSTLHAAYGFDSANLVFQAIKEAAILTPDDRLLIPRTGLRDALFATRDFPGATGMLTCRQNGDCQTSG